MAADHVDEIDQAGLRQPRRDRDAFLAREAAVPVLVAHHPDADGKVLADPLADRAQNLEAEPHAVLDRAAIGVRALVGRGRPELIDEMPVAFELHPIEARFLHALGALGIGPDDAGDVPVLHDLREGAMRGLAHVRGGDHRQPVGLAPARAASEMRDLDHHGGALRMDIVGELFEPAHDLVLVELDVAEGLRTVRREDGRAADHGQPDAAPGLFGVIKPVARLRHAVFGVGWLVRGRHQPVAECEMLEAERHEERDRGHGG